MSDSVENIQVKISSEFNEQGINSLKASLKGVDTQVKTTKQSIDQMGIGLQTLASGALTAFIVKAVNMGAELNVLRSNFIGSAKDIELFRKATAGTVDDAGLIKLSNYASDLGVQLKDQAMLFSLAEDAADKYGGSVESNFERVINASDGSARGLRAVGISTKDFEQELNKLVATTGKHLDSMDAEEQQNLRLQAIFNLTGVSIESVNDKTQDTKDKMDSLQVTVTNLTAQFGSSLVNSLETTINKLVSLNDATTIAGSKLFTFNELVASIGSAIGDISPLISVFKLVENRLDDIITKWKQVFQSAEKSTQTFQFQYGNEDAIQFDKFGNPIVPKGTFAENTNYTAGKNLGFNPNFSKGGTGTNKVAKEIVKAAYDDLKDQMIYLFHGGSRSAYDIFSVKTPVSFLPGTVQDNQLSSINPIKQDSRDTLQDIQQGYSLLSQAMSVLNIGADTFVGKLMSFFNFANSTLNVGSQIFSFVKTVIGLGAMPSGSGGSLSVDTNRMINQSVSMNASPVNIYMSSNVNQKYFKAQIENYNAMKQYTRI